MRRLAEARRIAGLTQDQLAAKTGNTRNQLANIESGRTVLRFLDGLRLCRVLNASVSWLHTGQGARHPFADVQPGHLALILAEETPDAPFAVIMRKWGDTLFLHTAERRMGEKEGLTQYPQEGKNVAVQPILPRLLERLRQATAARGSKTKLAAWLGVSPQKVTDWLSGRVEPSGETTLRLLHWVEQQERQQQQSPGSAAARPGPKTQSKRIEK
ncbi:MAG: helix-turn-helix domain-containing protein [Verrucomicrobia bacterium]|nr:helix-turn-helix domain-containing protein [Verrucomicrobiota bacterium]